MSDSNRTKTSLVVESTAGETPVGDDFLIIPKASCSLRDNTKYVESDIIRDDCNVQSVQKVGSVIGGSVATELFFSASGESIHALMQGAFRTTETAAATEVTGVACSGGVLSATGIHTGVEVGDLVKVRTSADALVGVGYFPVSVVGTNSITVTGSPTNGTGYKVVRGARMKNGTTDIDFSIEHARLDATLYSIFRGLAVSRMSMAIADEQITKLNFDFAGLNSSRGASAYAPGYTAHTDRDPITAVSVPMFRIAGTTYEFVDMSINVDTSAVARRRVGLATPTRVRRGTARITGTVNIYLDAWTELVKYSDGTASDMQIVQQDSEGNAYGLVIPKLKWTDGMADTRGKDQDDFKRLTFQAELNSTQGISARWQRFVA